MSTLWDETTETVETKSWVRSWRQELYTDLGSDFRMVAHLEKVLTTSDGSTILGRQTLPNVQTTASQCATDPVLGPLAYQIQTAMTALVDELRRRETEATPLEPMP